MPAPPTNLPSDLNAMFGDLFGQFFGGKFDGNLAVDLKLTETEAVSGVTRDVSVSRPSACDDCEGRGSKNPNDTPTPCKDCKGLGKREHTQGFFKVATICATCKGAGKAFKDPCGSCTGSGRVSKEATVSVVVPPNIEHGKLVQVAGEGGLGDDGKRGMLYVYVLIGDRPDPREEAMAAAEDARRAAEVGLPTAEIHRPPMPAWQVALIGIVVLALLGALLVAR